MLRITSPSSQQSGYLAQFPAFNRPYVGFGRLVLRPPEATASSERVVPVGDAFTSSHKEAPIVSMHALRFDDPIARKALVDAFLEHGYAYLKPDTVDGKRLLDMSSEAMADFEKRTSTKEGRQQLQTFYQTKNLYGAGYSNYYSYQKDLNNLMSFEEVYKKPENIKNFNSIRTFQMLGKNFLDPLYVLDSNDDPYNIEFLQRKIYMAGHRVGRDVLKAIQSVYKPKQNLKSLIEQCDGGASRLVSYDSPEISPDNPSKRVLVSAPHLDSSLLTIAIKETAPGLHKVDEEGRTVSLPIKDGLIVVFPGKLLQLMSEDCDRPLNALNHCVFNHGRRSAQVVFVSPDNGLPIRTFEKDALIGNWNKIVEKDLKLDTPTERGFRSIAATPQAIS